MLDPRMTADRLIAIAAFRYALGRMTYMPSHVGGWLIKNKDALPQSDWALIVREIDEADRRNTLGMDCDRETWMQVRRVFSVTPPQPGNGTGSEGRDGT